MNKIFSAAFPREHTPYSPAQFLYSWWRHAANLAGYEHFLISTVDGMHANSGTISPRARYSQDVRAGDVDCPCIVHRVFSGLLRSDVTCTVCDFTSTTDDPCVDIPLDLEPDFGTEKGFTELILNGELGGWTSVQRRVIWGFHVFGVLTPIYPDPNVWGQTKSFSASGVKFDRNLSNKCRSGKSL